MSDMPHDPEQREAATEAAQRVVDEVTSWEYSAERDTVEAELDAGLDQAGVDVDGAERERLVDRIEDVKRDESRGAPVVADAEPAEPVGSDDET
ncbi:MAG: hypothetical protein ACRCZD_17210 [Phycicoccus sp.]